MKSAAKLAAALALCLPFAAHAHDVWIVPSSTVLSGTDSWITVDAAVGNDKFYFNHAPLRLDGLTVTAPDGNAAEAENINRGKLRSTFDLQLKQAGTYRVAVVNDGVFARWKEDGKNKRYFGKVEGMAQAVPAKADELEVSQSLGRVETFVTAGKPSAVKPVGRGLELAPVTHPNDLFTDEAATFQMLLDGKPAADLDVNVVPGGSRYRDKVGEIQIKTDKDGKFSVKWPQPGLYWIEAGMEDAKVTVPQAKKRRLSYAGTVEVLQP
ncbi:MULTISPECIES: DUF4198 domain-containing protein [Achromobacter]|uniref:ABC transporter permease n=1 Tax=Achromobacter animicus TaxID=1389935 RepID=A0A6S6ZYY4_9BURK|nr:MULTISPECIES: DUF4198 domain-containing protein [Achromobacter]MBV7502451.1 DUF4198 domain-containing protein [Achromobacter sp. ACM05]MDH0682557.1 DUF4198 domain-containing protein [Achromobacter animicus]CAB3701537.1 hypothetical protein LMG26690_02662 [Achromobacter animicus]CAB3823088.1 hypothetical protein LMG26689_00566 [Achromobacter animicus]CAB3879276.1 hypothetical protein LMG26691_03401 [Achromobacter animicus]